MAARLQINEPREFGKVAVLMGGKSAEREISLLSGQAVFSSLQARGVQATAVDTADDLPEALRSGGFDRAWIALHGRGGEDGAVQGLLECFGIAYTGSGIKGSAICMDKLRTKQLIAGAGLGTPGYRVIRGPEDFAAVVDALGLPLMVKPADEGSSIGLTRVEAFEDLHDAYTAAARYRCEVFAERWVTGPEYTVAILQGQALPLVRIDAANTFYDYQAKYFSDATRYVCPSELDPKLEESFAGMAVQAFAAVGADGWGRVDFMLDESGQPLLLEINTVPGMTTHSLVPMAAKAAGIDFDELVWRILETSIGSNSAGLVPEAANG